MPERMGMNLIFSLLVLENSMMLILSKIYQFMTEKLIEENALRFGLVCQQSNKSTFN
jgi:hypothetical protein